MIPNITTKDMLRIIAANEIDSSSAWDEEFSIDVIKMCKLLSIDLDKITHVIDDPKLIITAYGAMKDAEKSMIKLQAYFASFKKKYDYLLNVQSLDNVKSTITDMVEEHDPDSFA